MSNIKKYKELLILIGGNIKNKHDKYFLSNNIDILATKFNNLANIILNISDITFDKNLSFNQKITKMTNSLPFTKSESQKLMNNIFLNKKENKDYTIKNNNNLQVGGFFNIFDCIPKKDFKKPLDLIYILLFVLASFPFAIGAFSDFIIICKALVDRRIFLATMVSTSLFFSMFTLHIIDMGLIFKILYALDNHSYVNYSRLLNDNKDINIKNNINNINNETINIENNTNKLNNKDINQNINQDINQDTNEDINIKNDINYEHEISNITLR